MNPESLEDLKIKERLLLSIIDEGQLNAMKEKESPSPNFFCRVHTPFKRKHGSLWDEMKNNDC